MNSAETVDTNLRKYTARPKFFGERAQRIPLAVYPEVVNNLLEQSVMYFPEIAEVEQLRDKREFGDIDLIGLTPSKDQPLNMEEIFGSNVIDYHPNGQTHSVLVRIPEPNMTVQADIIIAEDTDEYERLQMFFGKGYASGVIRQIARSQGFAYGTEGVFKRYANEQGHNRQFAISPHLQDGLRILGLGQEAYDQIHTLDDIVTFATESPFFDPAIFEPQNLSKADRRAVQNRTAYRYLVENLAQQEGTAVVPPEDTYFMQLFPDQYQAYRDTINRITEQTQS